MNLNEYNLLSAKQRCKNAPLGAFLFLGAKRGKLCEFFRIRGLLKM